MQYCDGTVWRAMGRIGGGDASSDLMAWWKFDEGSGVNPGDSTGNGWNAFFSSGTPTWGTGINGGDLTFNGTNQCVRDERCKFQYSHQQWLHLRGMGEAGSQLDEFNQHTHTSGRGRFRASMGI